MYILDKIKQSIESELAGCIQKLDTSFSIRNLSPLLSNGIKDFVLRKGKRIRPVLFAVAYLGFAKKISPGLYKSAVSLELFHDFMLIHDDIIDKSSLRRGKPSMHKLFDDYLNKYPGLKFNGQDLAIITGDIIYAMAIDVFMSIKENKERKEKALKKLIEAAVYTGCGEFSELLYGRADIKKITKNEIYNIYNLKTACYTFVCPLSTAAILAGAKDRELDLIYKYGVYLGNAYQIKDDLLGMFAQEEKIGKSPLVDLQESKKTILIWYAFKHSKPKQKTLIKKILSKDAIDESDLARIREISIDSGAKDFAEKEISLFIEKAQTLIASSNMRPGYKTLLFAYSKEICTRA